MWFVLLNLMIECRVGNGVQISILHQMKRAAPHLNNSFTTFKTHTFGYLNYIQVLSIPNARTPLITAN